MREESEKNWLIDEFKIKRAGGINYWERKSGFFLRDTSRILKNK